VNNQISKWVLGLVLVAVAQASSAVPITGTLQFIADGTFTSTDGTGNTDGSNNGLLDLCGDGVTEISDSAGGDCSSDGGIETGPATGFTFGSVFGNPAGDGIVTGSTASLDAFYDVDGEIATMVDIDLNNLPQNEFTVGLAALGGILKFVIETGIETDTGIAGKWDIGGTGYFDFTCDGSVSGCENEQTGGNWSISNTGGSLVIGFNAVPAPSVLALFGLGLLGLGVLRARRKV
jgi:hypothetical protein